jgi:hypothetical protein
LRRSIRIVASISVLTLVVASQSYAEGGTSVATAPTITFGQQEFGTTASGSDLGSFWLMNVTAGDAVAIDWESQGSKLLCLNPIGTTDFTIEKVHCVAEQGSGANGKNELTYTATGTGALPVQIFTRGGSGAPYNFTAYVTHALSVGMPHIAVLHSTGILTIPVHNPEGGPINDPAVRVTVQIKGRSSWQTIGAGTLSHSNAVISYRVPARLRHQRVAIRSLAGGTSYAEASSSHLKVRTL